MMPTEFQNSIPDCKLSTDNPSSPLMKRSLSKSKGLVRLVNKSHSHSSLSMENLQLDPSCDHEELDFETKKEIL